MLLFSGGRKSIRLALVWGLIGVVAWAMFLRDWGVTQGPQSAEASAATPPGYLMFFVLNVGSPLAFMKSAASGMGAAICVLMAAACIFTLRKGGSEQFKWIALIAFSAGSSLILAISRADQGLSQALNSRYFPFIVHGVIGAYASILYLHEKSSDAKARRHALLYGAVLATILIGITSGYTSGLLRGKEIREERIGMAEDLMNYKEADKEHLRKILGNVGMLTDRAASLEKLGYNVFRNKAPEM